MSVLSKKHQTKANPNRTNELNRSTKMKFFKLLTALFLSTFLVVAYAGEHAGKTAEEKKEHAGDAAEKKEHAGDAAEKKEHAGDAAEKKKEHAGDAAESKE